MCRRVAASDIATIVRQLFERKKKIDMKTGQIVYCIVEGVNSCIGKIPLRLENGLKVRIRHYW